MTSNVDEKTAWLDSWCKVRQLGQHDLARRWATRNDPVPDPPQAIKLRPMRKDEKPPIEFSDPRQQAIFEAYARKYWRMMRVPEDLNT